MTRCYLISVTALLIVFSVSAIELRFLDASQTGGNYIVISDNFQVCPNDIFGGRFTVECFIGEDKESQQAPITFTKPLERTENYYPYTLFGDNAMMVRQWNNIPLNTPVDIACESSNDESISVTGTFTCDAASNASPPDSTSDSSSGSESSTTSNYSNQSSSASDQHEDTCVVKLATDYENSLPNHFTNQNGILWYKINDNDPGIDRAPQNNDESKIVKYTVQVPTDGTYALAFNMFTNHATEHNDIWARCSFEFDLNRRGNRVPQNYDESKFLKIYHNSNGESAYTSTVDHRPHSVISRYPLKAGQQYTCEVAGRSTKTGFSALILIPCSGATCWLRDPAYEHYINDVCQY